MNQCIVEVDKNLPPLGPDNTVYSVADAESSLPLLRDCIKENFRILLVFTMPLARRMMKLTGVEIGGHHIPQFVSRTLAAIFEGALTKLIAHVDVCRNL